MMISENIYQNSTPYFFILENIIEHDVVCDMTTYGRYDLISAICNTSKAWFMGHLVIPTQDNPYWNSTGNFLNGFMVIYLDRVLIGFLFHP